MRVHTALIPVLLAAPFLSLAVAARADSDGFYCTSGAYLAYDLREGITPGVKGHILRVVRFDSKQGIERAGEITLEDFQTHQMTCTPDHIEMSGWDSGFQKYVIDVKGRQNPAIAEHVSDPTRRYDRTKEPSAPPRQLGYERLGEMSLETNDSQHKYKLLFSSSSENVPTGTEYRRTAEVLQSDLNGKIQQRVLIYEMRRIEGGE